ncbi:CBS domain-containing protein CBSX5-like [Pistacia vera]|uniref:CBS domain-containing protein CBSX5-like n=1 Tax=Pistacia vera TaxID=55513 RepID=UPI0012636FB7|nr:CBS domain-containing protein CBSX5-like [Pistacia vera]
MAVSLLSNEVSDLCIGKPALRGISVVSATVGDALSALKRFGETYISVWSCDHSQRRRKAITNGEDPCKCISKICMVDIVCFLCKEENLLNLASALEAPVSVLLPKASGIVRHLEPNASLLDAINLMLEGAQNIVIPLPRRKKFVQKPSLESTLHNDREYCWLTQEDIIRYFLNSIGVIGSTSNHPINSLNIIDNSDILAIHYDEPATLALPFIAQSHITQTSVAVVDDYGKLVGDISPFALNSCDETVVAAIATLSVDDLMAYVDCGKPPKDLVQVVKKRLEERNMGAFVELMEDDWGISSSCSSDDEDSVSSGRSGRSGGYYARVVSRSEAIVCYPWSSLMAVIIQALARRVSYVWVVDEDGTLAGIVTFARILKVFQERLRSMTEAENPSFNILASAQGNNVF